LPILEKDKRPLHWTDDAPYPSIHRSTDYLNYKAGLGNIWVDAAGSPVWIRLREGQLLVGELFVKDHTRIIEVLAALRKFARYTGCQSVVWFSKDQPYNLPPHWKVRKLGEWTSQYADLNGTVSLANFELCFSDLDLF
jgi:hypothetical protein